MNLIQIPIFVWIGGLSIIGSAVFIILYRGFTFKGFVFKGGKKDKNHNYLLFDKIELLNKKIWNIEDRQTRKQQMTQSEIKLHIILDLLNDLFMNYINSDETIHQYQKINYFSLFIEYFEKRQKEEIRNMLSENYEVFADMNKKDFDEWKENKINEFVMIGSKIFERYYSADMPVRLLFRSNEIFIKQMKEIINNLIDESREIQLINIEKVKLIMLEKEEIYKEFD